MEYPITDSEKETRLSVEFMTWKPDGLIVLAEGSSDHLVVQLKESHIFVLLSIRNLKFEVNVTDVVYNNGKWHRIDVERINSELKFSVDGQLIRVLRRKPLLSGSLQIDRSICVGGISDFRKPSLTFNTVGQYFHGCIANVTFNGRDILLPPRTRPRDSGVYVEASRIAWGRCDKNVFNSTPLPQSFVLPGAHVSYDKWAVRFGGELTFDFRTDLPNGLLLFNGGRKGYPDYIGLELVSGRLRLGIDYGHNTTVTRFVGENLNNGHWHSVLLEVSIKKVKIQVGKFSKFVKIYGRRGLLDVAGAFFVGGIRESVRQEAVDKGMLSVKQSNGGSFIGCLRALTINNVEVNPQESKNSRGVSLGCSYVRTPAMTTPAMTAPAMTTPTMTTMVTSEMLKTEPESTRFSEINVIRVREGEHVVLSVETIHIAVRGQSDEWLMEKGDNITFHLKEQPKHGNLKHTSDVVSSFSYTSLLNREVLYYHDGSDDSNDSFVFSLSFMDQVRMVVVDVIVEPVNDIPILVRPRGNVRFTVLSGTRSYITSSDLLVTDSDNTDSQVVFELLSGRPIDGQLELADQPNVPVLKFTQAQINNNELVFHHMNLTHRSALVLTLLVTDGEVMSVFRFAINIIDAGVSLNVTPLTVSHGSSVNLNASTITVTTAATEKQLLGVETRFRLVSQPHDGVVTVDGRQLQSGDFFTQTEVDSQLVAYRHNPDRFKPEDQFQLEALVGFSRSQNQTVHVSVSLGLIHVQLSPISVREGQTVVIDDSLLKITVNPMLTFPVELLIEIENKTRHGQLVVIKDSRQRQPADTFTVEDIEHGRLVYSHDNSETDSDSFTFHIQVTSSLPDDMEEEKTMPSMRIDIKISLVNDQQPEIIRNSELQLLEGSSSELTSKHLLIEDRDTPSGNLIITVTQAAVNGFLSLKTAAEVNISFFTQQDINDNNLLFTHVRSRSLTGGFSFEVTDGNYTLSDQTFAIQAVPLSLNVSSPRGKPVLVDTSHSMNTRITSSHLMAQTNDHLQDKDITFVVTVDPLHGYLANKHRPQEAIPSFTQADIDNGLIKYFLTDEHPMITTDSVTLRASIGAASKDFILPFKIIPRPLPYIVVNKGLDVAEHEEVIITKNELEASDVQNSPPSQLVFYIESGPMHGHIFIDSQANRTTSSFTQAVINQKELRYYHHGGQVSVDRLSLTLSNGKYNRSGIEFLVVIYSRHLNVTIHGLQVEEGSSRPITSDMIRIVSTFNKLFVRVFNSPSHGHLTLTSNRTSTVNTISLSQLKAGEVIYQHDDSESTHDWFEFNITDKFGQSRFSGLFNISIALVNDNSPREVNLKPLIVFQYGRVPITDKNLLFTDDDADYDDSLLQYEVWSNLSPKTKIVRKGEWDTAISHFTQNDISSGHIFYVHSGGRLKDKKSLVVSDGKHQDFILLKIDVRPVNIEVIVNTGLVVFEGSYVVISGGNLTTTVNINHTTSDVVYDVMSPPAHGKLLLSNVEVSNFSQQDVNSGILVYQHDESDSSRDGIGLTVSFGPLTPVDLVITIAVDNAPVILKPKPFIVDEGGNATLTIDFLKASDSDQSDNQIVFTIVRPPSSGQLLRVTSTGLLQPITSFTQSDINSSVIVYQHQGESTSRDGWIFSVTDGHNVVRSQPMFVEVIPLHIILTTEPLIVDEGGNEHFTEQQLFITSVQLRERNVKFTLLTRPTHGVLEVVSQDGRDKTSDLEGEFVFYSHDLSSGLVLYEHDGEESSNDSFTVIASEGHRQSDIVRVVVSIRPVNDQRPVVVVNKPLKMWVNDMTSITTDHLSYKDGDTDSNHIIYMVTQKPDNGHLILSTNASHEIDVFTQLDLEEGRVLFHHSGNNAGGFRFEVSDGNTVLEDVFGIVATPLELIVTHLIGLMALPGEITLISPYNLSVVSNEVNSTRPITFTLESPYLLRGAIVSTSPPYQPISVFTMSDIEADIIGYKHTDLLSWLPDDHFYFNVSMALAETLTQQLFSIQILLKHTPGSRLASNNLLTVQEGGSGLITSDYLDASNIRAKAALSSGNVSAPITVIFNVTVPPRHGTLVKTTVPGLRMTAFTQEDISTGQIKYKHNGSETVTDSFLFELIVGHTEISVVEWFNITITPVNDQPFRVVTIRGINMVEGMSQVVTPNDLLTVDEDTNDKDIIYELVHQSAETISLQNVNEPQQSIQQFSQEDINEGRIQIVHDNTNVLTIRLVMKISDGKHKPLVKSFPVTISPLLVTVLNKSAVQLEQGVFTVKISADQLTVTTNGRLEEIVYVIVNGPMYGRLTVRGQRSNNFTQMDLNDRHVVYTQEDKKEPEDQFSLTVMYNGQKAINVTVPIAVKPLVHIKQLETYNGQPVAITQDILDASLLANLTNSNPLFTVISPLVQSAIYFETVLGITVFRHQDILNGKVKYTPGVNMTYPNTTVYYDQIIFELSVGDDSSVIVQPAQGVLPVVVHLTSLPASSTSSSANTSTPSTPKGLTTSEPEPTHLIVKTIATTGSYSKQWNGLTETDESGEPNLEVNPASLSGGNDAAAVAIPIIVILFVIIAAILGVIIFRRYQCWKQKNLSRSTSAEDEIKTENITAACRTAVINTDPGVESTDSEEGFMSDGTDHDELEVKQSSRREARDVNENKGQNQDEGCGETEWPWEGTEYIGVQHANPKLQGNEYWV